MAPSHRIIAVASGKGGVGKTWFAITLAQTLCRRGSRVLLFDGDMGLANIDIQLGIMPEWDLAGVLGGQCTLARSATHHEATGLDIVAGRSGSGLLSLMDPVDLERILDGLRAAADDYDAIVLDLGAGVEHNVRRMAGFADLLLVLATDEPTSLTDAYVVLKLHAADRPDGDARIVVNQAPSRTAGERTYQSLKRACETFLHREPALAGVIRRDDHVRDSIRRQTPLLSRYPSCHAARDVDDVVHGLMHPPAALSRAANVV